MKQRDIAKLFGMSEAGVSLAIKSGINNIVDRVLRERLEGIDIFDVCLAMMEYFGMEGPALLKKLNKKHTAMLKRVARERYNIPDEGNRFVEQFFG